MRRVAELWGTAVEVGVGLEDPRSPSGCGGSEGGFQERAAGLCRVCRLESDSWSVYGTGRIHCEQSRSVNYRRAIHRAETEPRASERARASEPLTHSARTPPFPGVRGTKTSPSVVPGGLVPVPSAWPILALAHFCLYLSALSNHVQCQYGKSGLLRPHSPPPCLPGSMLLTSSLAHLA